MLLIEFKKLFTNKLSSTYPKTEIDAFFFLLIEEQLGLQRIDTVLKPDFLIPEKELHFLNDALQRLKKEEPIQYILGKTEFYGLPFTVNKNTLIPRPETEELVAWILEKTEARKMKSEKCKIQNEISILDIGTGTGCIPIALAKNLTNATISAIDISKEALKIANKNAILNNVYVNFFEADILKVKHLNGIHNQSEHEEIQYDILVSNPPYVRELEKVEIKNNVLQNEPHLALFVEDKNPLIFYEKIADLAKIHLKENGLLFFEINQYLGKETVAMLQEKGFQNIELRKDIFGNDRMIKVLK